MLASPILASSLYPFALILPWIFSQPYVCSQLASPTISAPPIGVYTSLVTLRHIKVRHMQLQNTATFRQRVPHGHFCLFQVSIHFVFSQDDSETRVENKSPESLRGKLQWRCLHSLLWNLTSHFTWEIIYTHTHSLGTLPYCQWSDRSSNVIMPIQDFSA